MKKNAKRNPKVKNIQNAPTLDRTISKISESNTPPPFLNAESGILLHEKKWRPCEFYYY